MAQGNGRLFCCVGGSNGAAGSLGNMESSLVSLLDAGTGSCHALRTANPTAVTAGRLLGKKRFENKGFCAVALLIKVY